MPKCLGMAGFECFEPGRGLLPLGAGGSSQSSLWSGSAHRHALHRIWQRVSPFGPRRSFGCWWGGSSCSWLFFHGRSLLWQDEWRQQRCLSQKEVIWGSQSSFSCGGLLYKMTWQAERKALWLLNSSPTACSSRSCMYLPCSLWNIAAWETFWALASQMALEQAASASWTKQPQVVLAFLTAARKLVLVSRINQEQAVWASRVTWEQMTLASLMDAAAWDSFWQSITPSSQTALHLLTSMDPLVLCRSLRALLALVQSSARSIEGLMLLLLEMAAIGEILVGMSSREASASSTLTWDEVSTAWSGSSGFEGGVMRTTAVVDLLGDEHLDTSWMLPALLKMGGYWPLWSYCLLISREIYVDWLSGWWRPCQKVVSFGLVTPWGVGGCWSLSRYVHSW